MIPVAAPAASSPSPSTTCVRVSNPTRRCEEVEALGTRTLFGREKEDLVYPLALANLMLHGVDRPHIWHGNTLTGGATYDGLWRDVPSQFDIVLTNPPFGGKEGKEAQIRLRLQDQRDANPFSSARDRPPEARRALRHGGRRGRAVPHQRERFRPDQAQAARFLRILVHRVAAGRRVHQRGRGRQD